MGKKGWLHARGKEMEPAASTSGTRSTRGRALEEPPSGRQEPLADLSPGLPGIGLPQLENRSLPMHSRSLLGALCSAFPLRQGLRSGGLNLTPQGIGCVQLGEQRHPSPRTAVPSSGCVGGSHLSQSPPCGAPGIRLAGPLASGALPGALHRSCSSDRALPQGLGRARGGGRRALLSSPLPWALGQQDFQGDCLGAELAQPGLEDGAAWPGMPACAGPGQ